MISEDLLLDLLVAEVERLGPSKGLTAAETERIVVVCRQAAANRYMDERRIYPALVGKDDPSS